MVDYGAFTAAVTLVRDARLLPTHVNIAAAKVLLDRGASASISDLVDSADDEDLGLSREALIGAVGRFVRAGVMPAAAGHPAAVREGHHV